MRNSIVLLLVTGTLLAASLPTAGMAKTSERPWLGVVLVRADSGELSIETIAAGSPAERAGLRAGDRLLRVAGESVRFLPALLLDLDAGDSLRVTVEREGGQQVHEVTLGDWPDDREPPPLPVYRKKPSTPASPSHADRQEA